MFGRSKAVSFDPYGRRRSRRRLPGWFWLLFIGVASGAGGLFFVQERYLPPRLSAAASETLNQAWRRTDAERLRLSGELDATSRQLAAALAAKATLTREVTDSRAGIERLQGDLAAVVEALPADPRNAVIEVRAARFAAADGRLDYDLVLTRKDGAAKVLAGVLKLVITGASAQRAEASVTLKPIALSMGSQQILRGSQPLPEGFAPRQVTVQVLDKPDGRMLGMRVLRVP